MLAAQNQVVDQPANGLPFPVAPLAHFDPQFFIQPPGHAQSLGEVVEQHRPCMTGQLLFPKTDVELAHFSHYLLGVHLLGASFSATWGLSNHHCCRERRHFSSHWVCSSYPLPVDSGENMKPFGWTKRSWVLAVLLGLTGVSYAQSERSIFSADPSRIRLDPEGIEGARFQTFLCNWQQQKLGKSSAHIFAEEFRIYSFSGSRLCTA